MRMISNQHYDLVVDVVTDYISMIRKDCPNLAKYNKARRASVMLKTWARKEAKNGK